MVCSLQKITDQIECCSQIKSYQSNWLTWHLWTGRNYQLEQLWMENQKQHLFNGSTVQTLSDSKGRKVFFYKSTLGPFFKSF